MHREDLTYQKHKNVCHIGAGKISDMMLVADDENRYPQLDL